MRTLIVSDLHLGAGSGVDLLSAPAHRERLAKALDGADRIVLLGDTLELRRGPARAVLAAADPILRELAPAFAGAEAVLVPGNHDHALVAPWLQARGRDAEPPPLGLEQRLEPGQASPLAAALAESLGARSLTVAYPGVWLREDVYATHGHYLDCHAAVPTLERLAAGAMAKLLGELGPGPVGPDDYEALLAPIYAWIDAVAARGTHSLGGSARTWRMLAGGGRRPLRARALAAAFPLAVAALNRAGLGPLSSDLSRDELRRSGVRGMAEVVERMRIRAAHVVFGHTHRAGPLATDDRAEWRAPTRAALVNSGCWVYEPSFMAGLSSQTPFWPGCCVALEDAGPPRLARLLEALSPAELQGTLGAVAPGG